MIAVNYTEFRNQMKNHLDLVTDDYETVVVTRKENKNVVVISEESYNNLLENIQKGMGLSYLFIAHDLSMVKHISDKIGVMYLGHMVEMGKSEDVYHRPLHPYTTALLSAIPIPDPDTAKAKSRIILEGEIPSPINPPAGCPFSTRCPKATERCRQEMPQPIEVGGRIVACHLYER